MAYTNSPLVAHTKLSPNNSGQRTHSIDRITPHCVVGQCTAEGLGDWFAKSSTQASSNYGIDKNGRIGMYVEEKNRSWCTSNRANDQRAVTIECASGMKAPYEMNDKVYASLIKLCTDICRRNGKTKLLWFGNKNKTLAYEPKSNEMVLTVHRWFANKSCPGDWLYSRLGDLADKVTSALNRTSSDSEKIPVSKKLAYAKSKDASLAGSYRVIARAGLNLRCEPGKLGKEYVIQTIPENAVVYNHGYYTVANGIRWLYVEYRRQVGFVHSSYLRKI